MRPASSGRARADRSASPATAAGRDVGAAAAADRTPVGSGRRVRRSAPFVVPSGKQKTTPRSQNAAPKSLKTKWTARVGKTTFRTTMALVDASVVIGTHGDTLKGLNAAADAVYVVEAATGKITRKIATPGKGDKDAADISKPRRKRL